MSDDNRTDDQMNWLGADFLHSLDRYPDRPAIEVDGATLTYSELFERANGIVDLLREHAQAGEPPLTAVFASRSQTAFIGVLAVVLRGYGYVPLSPNFPAERTRFMLERSDCRSIIVDDKGEALLEDVLAGYNQKLTLIFPDREDVTDLKGSYPLHTVIAARNRTSVAPIHRPSVGGNDIAYLLFTSGSTGNPKGVMVSHRNICRFLEVMSDRYLLNETDRLSHMFELVFDLSAFDLFMSWRAGACLCCPGADDALVPANYIRSSEITVWFSVPSMAVFLNRLRQLEADTFPHIRLSLFCGEALPADAAQAWAAAAPNAVLENLYGPTEVTLAFTFFRWQGETSLAECENGFVPIGEPYPGMSIRVVDEAINDVPPGQPGELLVMGPQVALGYFKDAEKTAEAFITIDGGEDIYYRTGDLVRRPTEQKPMTFLGRIDNQVKIRGNRVELGEIEAVLKKAAKVPRVVAIGWPVRPSGVDGVVAFLESASIDDAAILNEVKKRLPNYMVPHKLVCVETFPSNSNGKIDRKALLEQLNTK